MSDVKMKAIEVHGSRTKLWVENIKCGGCAKSIRQGLNGLGLGNVAVNETESSVEFDNPKNAEAINTAVQKLRGLGYPLIETEQGLKAAALKAKSYLSCAIGKMSS